MEWAGSRLVWSRFHSSRAAAEGGRVPVHSVSLRPSQKLVSLLEKGRSPSDQALGHLLCPSGPRLSGGHSLHETSTVLVETVTKSSSSRGASYSSIPKFSSDASKVVTRGPGLSQAFVGQKNSFTVDCSKAGKFQPRGWSGVRGRGRKLWKGCWWPCCEPLLLSASLTRYQHDDGGRAWAQDPL